MFAQVVDQRTKGINIGAQPQVFQLIGKRGNTVHCHRVTLSGDIRNPLSEATITGTLFPFIPCSWTHPNKQHCQTGPSLLSGTFLLGTQHQGLRGETEGSTKQRCKLFFSGQTPLLTDRSCHVKRSSHTLACSLPNKVRQPAKLLACTSEATSSQPD